MYGWIWRKLPFGVPGKLIGFLIIVGGVAAFLWYWAFPRLDPLMPFNDSQITNEQPAEDPSGAPSDQVTDGSGSDDGSQDDGSDDEPLLPGD